MVRDKVLHAIEEFFIQCKESVTCFHSEQQIQLLLAYYFKENYGFNDVFVEYDFDQDLIVDYPWKNDNKISIDIVVHDEGRYIPIEIKYRTRKKELPITVFGSEYKMSLANQSAKNQGCYLFWKDVKRIELFKSNFNLEENGIVLFVTNDESYKKEPQKGSDYAPFSIHDGKEINGELDWDDGNKSEKSKKERERFPSFKLDHTYQIQWKEVELGGQTCYYMIV